MSRFIVVMQEKGGVAKTFLAVHLTTYLRRLGHKFRPVDLDNTSGTVSKVFPPPDCASVSPRVDLIAEGKSLLPSLLERVAKGELFIVDAGANSGPGWETVFQMLPHLRDDMSGTKITLIVPVTSDERTHLAFTDYDVLFPGATKIMVVVKEFKDEQFALPKHPAELTFELPLAPKNLFAAYKSTSTPIDSIAESNDPRFGITRAFAKGYTIQLHAQFDKFRTHLVP